MNNNFFLNISIDVGEQTENDLKLFTINKSLWNNRKCEEIQELIGLTEQNASATNLTILNACGTLLCTGPSYSEQDAAKLTSDLRAMQTISVSTQICLPKHFDICRNWDRIWDFTYVLRDDKSVEFLNLSVVRPKS